MTKLCKNCREPVPSRNDYCDNKCQQDSQYKEYIFRWWKGLEPGWTGKTRALSKHVRRFVREVQGAACRLCGWNLTHPDDHAILTEIDHIDGDVENTNYLNLRVLCPNCHSMTPTFRARNKVSKRNRLTS